MNWDDVRQRIDGGENATTEFGRFRSFSEKDWLKPVCALANTEGGLVVLGVQNDGTLDGVPMEPELVQERLTNGLQNGLSAPVQGRVGRHLGPDGWVHWVEVARMRGTQPLRYKDAVFVRRGRSSVAPSESELAELYNAFGLFFTEERVVPGTSASDIDFEVFRNFMGRRGIDLASATPLSPDEELTRAEVLAPNLDGAREATLYGLLCFGREPQRSHATRGFYVQLAAYAGQDPGGDVLSTAEARGRLDEQVRRTEEWLRSLGRVERYAGFVREQGWIVPPIALREAIVNAVAHRDYSLLGQRVLVEVFDDRIAVTSHGGLPNHKTPESVLRGGPPRSRNEAIADFMLVMGLMEGRGTGFPRMRNAMRAFNGTEPELETNPDERWVRVVLRRG